MPIIPIHRGRAAIAHRLKTARLKAGYETAAQFCEQHEISLERYLRQETGERALKWSDINRYSEWLNVSVSWLLLGL